MADPISTMLDHENHLLLDQPLVRLPFELLKKNFRLARFEVERESTFVKETLKETAGRSVKGASSQDDVLKSLDQMLARMRGVKRKLATFSEEENRLHRHELARVKHLSELYSIHSVDDVKYETWSRKRLDRLVVDYLLRQGYYESAEALAEERGISLLADVETFKQMGKIRNSLLRGSVTEALAWCSSPDNKKELRKMNSNLEFMLRWQQYIELVRNQSNTKPNEALKHARKYLVPYKDTYKTEVLQACGLLAIPPNTAQAIEAYRDLYFSGRWEMLANLFTKTHNELLSLPPIPLLHVALSPGLSALKTPACHSSSSSNQININNTGSSSSGTTSASTQLHQEQSTSLPTTTTTGSLVLASSLCPICSTELNELARNVPYAFHSKSHVENDLCLLPNRHAYGKARLQEYAKKSGLPDGQVKDLRTGELYEEEQLKKVYIT